MKNLNMVVHGCPNSDESLFRRLLNWYRDDLAHVLKWRDEAREDFDFYNGKQWSDYDEGILKRQKRPVMVFNRVAPLINAIVGSERNNKREVQFIPRTEGVALPSHLLTGAAEWFRHEADAETSDSDAFRDMVICGMGWTETRLDDRDNPDGKPWVSTLDPLKMVWDCNAVQTNLSDAQRLWYIDEKPLSVAMELFPDVSIHDLHAGWADHGIMSEESDYVYDEDSAKRRTVTIVECRWFDSETCYRTYDVESVLRDNSDYISSLGDDGILSLREFLNSSDSIPLKDYTEEEFNNVCMLLGGSIRHTTFKRRVVKRAFLGNKLLEPVSTPIVPSGQLGWECITGYYHKNNRHFYGVVRSMKDPQSWANKFYSQIMHILNSQAKGGILAEMSAFVDQHQAMESYAKSDGITFVRDGALIAKKIQPKPKVEYPSGFMQLFIEAKEAINDVTGISEEFMGVREVNQAGVLEAQRRQSSLNLLASLFDALRLYRQRQGRLILHLLQNCLSDGRLIRITNRQRPEYVRLMREDIIDVEYDIIVDDAPLSPNEKERTFNNLMQLMPLMKDIMTPDLLVEFLKFSPLPTPLIESLAERVELQMQQAQAQTTEVAIDPEKEMKLRGMAQDMQMKGQMDDIKLKYKQAELATKLQQMMMSEGMYNG